MSLSSLLGVVALVVAGAFLVLGLWEARSHRVAPDPSTPRYAPKQAPRFLLSALAPAALAAYAFSVDPEVFAGSPVLITLVGFSLLMCLVALTAIVWSGSDFVEIGKEELKVRQLGQRWFIPWSDFADIVDRGPYQLRVLLRPGTDAAAGSHDLGRRRRGNKRGDVYITTLHLSANQSVIQSAVRAGADRWRDRVG